MEPLSHLPVPALHRFERLPDGFVDAPVERLGDILPGPSLIRIEGEPGPPLFVSILLHGNETTGFEAMQRLLAGYDAPRRPLPRPVLLFVGNVAAAENGLRKLEGQADYNRIWHDGRYPEHRLAREVLAEVTKAAPLAAIDLHNNTGKNPHYGCVNRLDDATLSLARRFSKTIVWFTEPHEVISIALSRICPSVTLECGVSGNAAGTSHVEQYLRHSLELSAEALFTPPPNHLSDLFHTTARIIVREGASVEFGAHAQSADICLRADLETLNFERVPEGAELGCCRDGVLPLVVIDNDERDVTSRYLRFSEERIFTRLPIVPSMFTRDTRVIMQDCLGYIMEPYEVKG
ncbi:succinylglutamate desuccinylase [Chlorobaculum thiosulfatiphilum]|uniref:Succinylglutamate desuccinylase n=1 Tax=Chlorobaculum thiosulfatiphilum TaxID=115852 RepID=A0A5C4S5S3_CHLTI|nr:M14 family metallopeptidase [Chlorobaculum thiosulfatiphilum]TNJ38527.1 succinylglutamate desuccinylase [Chlorobaculum thiosulfatiphilum]